MYCARQGSPIDSTPQDKAERSARRLSPTPSYASGAKATYSPGKEASDNGKETCNRVKGTCSSETETINQGPLFSLLLRARALSLSFSFSVSLAANISLSLPRSLSAVFLSPFPSLPVCVCVCVCVQQPRTAQPDARKLDIQLAPKTKSELAPEETGGGGL